METDEGQNQNSNSKNGQNIERMENSENGDVPLDSSVFVHNSLQSL